MKSSLSLERSLWRCVCFVGLLLLVGCPTPTEPVQPFIVVTVVDQPGLVAPIPEIIKFTTSGVVNGNFITKDFEFEAADHPLPTDFVVRFSEGVRGNIIDISIRGFVGDNEVFTATTSGVAGVDFVEAVARFCGDETIDTDRVEDCDDGALNNDTEPNACRTTCSAAFCGDGVLDLGETCDDGPLNSDTAANACRPSCEFASCGDGVVDANEQCDNGASNSDTAPDACRTSCVLANCGDGAIDSGEDCDDANGVDGDSCDNDCVFTSIIEVTTGDQHTCALLRTGIVRCWGTGGNGRLGYGNTSNIGDNELPVSAGNVSVGSNVIQVASGGENTCVLLSTGNVRCWGIGDGGRLGTSNTNDVGDNELPSDVGNVGLGGIATQIAVGGFHTCALLNTGNVRCWGLGSQGVLGYGNTNDIGDDELPSSAGNVNIGGTVTQITAGNGHTCALLVNSKVRCWGDNSRGQLGYGNLNDIGDNDSPSSAGDVNIGGNAVQVAAGFLHTCALLDTGKVRCWGLGGVGGFGYGNLFSVGDDETPASAGDVVVF